MALNAKLLAALAAVAVAPLLALVFLGPAPATAAAGALLVAVVAVPAWLAMRQRERQISQSESLQRVVWDDGPDMCGLVEVPSMRIKDCNRTFSRTLGYTRDELLGMHVLDLHVDRERAEGAVGVFLETGELRNVEVDITHRDGQVIPVSLNATGVRDESGKLVYAHAALRDISERRRVEDALRHSHQRYEQLFRGAQVSIWEEDLRGVVERLDRLRAEGVQDLRAYLNERPEELQSVAAEVRVTDVNSATLRMYGAERKEQLLSAFGEVLGPDVESVFLDGLCAIWAGHTLFRAEGRNRTLDGRELDVLITMPIPRGREAFARVPVSIVDLTEQNRARETALRRGRQMEVLSAAAQRINRVLEVPAIERTLIEAALEITGATQGAMGLHENGQMVFRNFLDGKRWSAVDYRFDPGYGVPGHILETREPYVSNDAANDPHVVPEIRAHLKFDTLADVPIHSRGGALLGCFEIHNKADDQGFDAWDVELLNGLAANAAIALENAGMLREREEVADRLRTSEQALRRSQDHFRVALQNSSIVVFTQDRDLRYSWISNVMAGFATEEYLGRTDAELLPESQAAGLTALKLEVMRSGEATRDEVWYDVDGAQRCYDLTVEPSRDAEGRVTGVICAAMDVTERKESEELLRQSATVFESTNDGVIITDSETRIVAVNTAFTEITGYPREEVLGQTPRILQSKRHDREFYDAMWTAIRTEGSWQGEIWSRRRNGEVYPEWLTVSEVRSEAGRVVNYVGVFSDITAIKRSQEEVEYLAHHDPLTGLPNRLLFNDRLHHALDRAQRGGHAAAILFLDLDRFKNINDSLGHPVGDKVLQAVADRLRDLVRQEDTVARLGGDEFIVLVEQLRGARDVVMVAEKLLEGVGRPFEVDGHELYLNVSIGISVFPEDGLDVATLVKNADAAMYRAKDRGRNNFQFYTAELTSSAFERVQLESSLRRALERDQLELYFQPFMALPDRELVGCEALVRWNHPERGLVPPGRFIHLAEESGLILPMGEWVLHRACEQAKAWTEKGLRPGRMSVNISGRQVDHGDFLGTVRRVLDATRCPPELLEFEVTEGFIMRQAEEAIRLLRDLKSLGIRLAIDDFGTGYSSLSYLKRLPVDRLKIDRSFVRDMPEDPDDEAIAGAVIALAHSLQLAVIAEGVETEAQEQILASRGCNEAQGYLYGRAVPAADYERNLSGSRFAGGAD